MSASGLEIDLTRLAEIASPPVVGTSAGTDGGGSSRIAVVSAEVLEETGQRYPDCRCEEMGLQPGYPVKELSNLGSGCTGETPFGEKGPNRRGEGGWVCQRLDLVRRRYGK